MFIKLLVTHGVVIDLMQSDETLPELKLSHKPIYISLHTKTFARRRDHRSNSFLDCLFASILMDFLVDKIMFHNHSLLHLWCYTTTFSQSKYICLWCKDTISIRTARMPVSPRTYHKRGNFCINRAHNKLFGVVCRSGLTLELPMADDDIIIVS